MRNLKSKIVCVLLAFLMLCINTPVSFETEVAMAAIEDDIIYADNLDIIFDTYKDVGAYAVAEYTGNYKATTGSNISSVAKEGNVSLSTTVTNDTLETSVVNVYSAVFDKFGDLMRVVKTDDVTLAALESREITADAVKVDEEEIHKVFVWDDELYPYELPEVKHNFRVSVSGTTAYLSWDKYEDSSDYTYEVYCDGELISAVSANSYNHTGVSNGKHT